MHSRWDYSCAYLTFIAMGLVLVYISIGVILFVLLHPPLTVITGLNTFIGQSAIQPGNLRYFLLEIGIGLLSLDSFIGWVLYERIISGSMGMVTVHPI